jgi:hypothetical protein
MSDGLSLNIAAIKKINERREANINIEITCLTDREFVNLFVKNLSAVSLNMLPSPASTIVKIK